MFNECFIHLFDCICLNVIYVCSSIYGSNLKDFWSFYMYLDVQWMLYSFVRLYLFKYDVCVLIYIWIKPKRFLIILYVFGSDFYHSLYSCFVLTLFFIILNMFCVEKQVLEFLATHLATHQLRNASRKFIQKLSRLACNSPVANRPKIAF